MELSILIEYYYYSTLELQEIVQWKTAISFIGLFMGHITRNFGAEPRIDVCKLAIVMRLNCSIILLKQTRWFHIEDHTG